MPHPRTLALWSAHRRRTDPAALRDAARVQAAIVDGQIDEARSIAERMVAGKRVGLDEREVVGRVLLARVKPRRVRQNWYDE
jgi:hypothetical protein